MKYYIIHPQSLIYQYYSDSANTACERVPGSDDIQNEPNRPYPIMFKAYPGVGRAPWPFLISSYDRFTVNTNVKNVLEKFNLCQHNFFKMTVDFREIHFEYWELLFNRKPIAPLIDFDKSIFWDNSRGLFHQSTETEKANAYIRNGIHELHVKKEIEQYDMLYVGPSIVNYVSHHIVSERLKNELKKHKFKKISFQEATWLKIMD